MLLMVPHGVDLGPIIHLCVSVRPGWVSGCVRRVVSRTDGGGGDELYEGYCIWYTYIFTYSLNDTSPI